MSSRVGAARLSGMKRVLTLLLSVMVLNCSGGGTSQTGSTTSTDAAAEQDGGTSSDATANDPDASADVVYLMVCRGITNDLNGTLRFRVTTPPGSKFAMTLGPLASTARTLSQSSVVSEPALLEDTDTSETTFTMTASKLNMPAEAVGTEMDVSDAKLTGPVPLATAVLTGQVTKPTSLKYSGKCVFLSGKDGSAFTVATDKISMGGREIVPSDLTP